MYRRKSENWDTTAIRFRMKMSQFFIFPIANAGSGINLNFITIFFIKFENIWLEKKFQKFNNNIKSVTGTCRQIVRYFSEMFAIILFAFVFFQKTCQNIVVLVKLSAKYNFSVQIAE